MGRPGAAPKRRTRAERTARQDALAQRRAAGIPDPPLKSVRKDDGAAASRVSWWGIAGSLWAASTLALAAMVYVITADEQWAENAVACGVGAVGFVPGIVISIVPSPRRETVLRAETALALGFAFFGVFVVKDVGIPVLLSPPTLMLATAAGWVFPGVRGKGQESSGAGPKE